MFWEALLPYRGLTGRSALQIAFSLCLSRKKRLPRSRHAQNAGTEGGAGGFTWDSPTIFPLPVDEKAILDNTPNKRACDGHFPLPVKGKAIRRPLGWACFDPVCLGKLCFPTESSPADPGEHVLFLLPVEEKTPPEASTCSKRQRQGGLLTGGLQPFSLCLSRKRRLPKPRNARHPRACL